MPKDPKMPHYYGEAFFNIITDNHFFLQLSWIPSQRTVGLKTTIVEALLVLRVSLLVLLLAGLIWAPLTAAIPHHFTSLTA